MKNKHLLFALIIMLCALMCFFVSCDEDGPTQSYDSVKLTCYFGDTADATVLNVNKTDTSLGAVPKRTHYTFAGLYDSESGGVEIVDKNGNFTVVVNKSMTLYARWIPSSYTFNFDVDGGEMVGEDSTTKSYVYGSSITVLPMAEKEGYEFKGWRSANGTMVSEGSSVVSTMQRFDSNSYRIAGSNVYLTAVWELKKVTVTFDYNDGSYQSQTKELYFGDSLSVSDFATEDLGDREIKGWSLVSNSSAIITEDIENIEQDITLYAVWSYYKNITFYEAPGMAPVVVKIYRDEPAYDTIPERPGYEFDGWYDSQLFSGIPYEGISYSTFVDKFYAKWNVAEYTVTFCPNNDETVSDAYYTMEGSLELPVVEKENYVFVGWCESEDLSDAPITTIPVGSYGNKTLYAKYKGENKTALLEAYEGTISSSTATIEYGSNYSIIVPMNTGYAFHGWYTMVEGEELQLTDKNGKSLSPWSYTAEETEIYAKYSFKYYVTINHSVENAGSVVLDEYYVEGETVNIVALSESGYTISGLYSGETLLSKTAEYSFTMPASNVTIDVVYKPDNYRVLLNKDGGYCKGQTLMLDYGAHYRVPVAYKQGYLFEGWMCEGVLVTDNGGASLAPWTYTYYATLKASYVEDPDAANTKLVKNLEDFKSIADDPTLTYALINDIDLAGLVWAPIDFSGKLLGNGFTIKNFSLSAASGNVAMFGNMTGTVRDIVFENVTIISTSYELVNVGVVAAVSSGTISGVSILSGSITVDVANVGGVVGSSVSGTIANCTNYAAISGTTSSDAGVSGGIAGQIASTSVLNCTNYGKITGKRFTAGIVGKVESSPSFSNCHNYGMIEGKIYTGGIIGQCSNGPVFSSLSNSASITGTNYTGGLIGELKFAGSVTYNSSFKNTGKIIGEDNVGGIFGCLSQYYNVENDNLYVITVNRFSNTADIKGNNNVGGIFGRVYVYASDDNGSYPHRNPRVRFEFTGLNNLGNVEGIAYVGGILGYAYSDSGDSLITECYSSADIKAEHTVGGLVGKVENTVISKCSNAGSTISATGYLTENTTYYAYFGGYAGYAMTISDCTNNADILYSEKGIRVGGIAGYAYGNISNCLNTGSVTAPKSSYVGGIAGNVTSVGDRTFIALSNSGNIEGLDYVGGIVGRLTQYYNVESDSVYTINITRLTNTADVKGASYVAGIFGYMHLYASDDNGSYPHRSPSVKYAATTFTNTGNATGTRYVAGLIGYSYTDNSSTITDSISSADITGESHIGGVVAWCENLSISDCSNKDTTITATGYYMDNTTYYAYIGGYVGYGTNISNCVNETEINYTEKGMYVGGIAGKIYGNVSGCTNTATINAPNSEYVAGIVGSIAITADKSYTNLENSGAITGKAYTAGIIGRIYQYYNVESDSVYIITFKNLENTADIKGTTSVGGLIGQVYLYASDDNGSYPHRGPSVKYVASELKNTSAVEGTTNIGGLIGYSYTDNSDSTLVDSISTTAIKATSHVGGLIGWAEGVSISESSNEGTTIAADGYVMDNTTYYAYIGGYVGYGYNISNCVNAVNIEYAEKGIYVGGIAGRVYGNISGCSNSGTVTAPKADYVGGIVGYVNYTGERTYTNLENSGAVTGNNRTGGIFGSLYQYYNVESDSLYTTTFTDIKNSASITGLQFTGGLIGHLYLNASDDNGSYPHRSPAIRYVATKLSNTGDVSGDRHVGGFMGYSYNDSVNTTITECTSSANITAKSHVGGLYGWIENATISSCSNENSVITATDSYLEGTTYYAYLGGYVGYGYHISDCSNAADIVYEGNGQFVGGIAGRAYGNLTNCTNSANITAENSSFVGGIVGYISCSGEKTYSVLENTGNVVGEDYVSGIIGKLYQYYSVESDSTYTITVTDVKNSGNITANKFVAGIFGQFDVVASDDNGSYPHRSPSIRMVGTSFENTGAISGNSVVGGFIGQFSSDATSMINRYTSTGEVSSLDENVSETVAINANLNMGE